MNELHGRYFAGRRNEVVDEARGLHLPLRVIDDFFVKRGTDALCDASLYLAVNDQWVDELAAVFSDRVMADADLESFRIDLDCGDMRRRTGGTEDRIIGLARGKLVLAIGGQAADLRINGARHFFEGGGPIGPYDRDFAAFRDEVSGRSLKEMRCRIKDFLAHRLRGKYRRPAC